MNYLFYIEGLNREVWVFASTRSEAHRKVWESLTEDEKNAVVQIEWLDEEEA